MAEELTMFKFHLLAAAPPEEVPDAMVETALMKVVINSEEDIQKICGILNRNRPELVKKLKKQVHKNRPAK